LLASILHHVVKWFEGFRRGRSGEEVSQRQKHTGEHPGRVELGHAAEGASCKNRGSLAHCFEEM